MKAIALFARTTIVGGVFFLAPIVVLIVILAKAFGFAKTSLQAVVPHIPGISDLSVGVATTLSIAMIALVCLLAGLVAHTLIAQRFVNALESSVLSKIPAYEYLKQESASALGVAEIGELPVVFVPMEGGWQLGVQTEALSNGLVSIFVPGAPNPHSGSVFFFSTDIVRPAGIKLAAGLGCLRRCGAGASALGASWPSAEVQLVAVDQAAIWTRRCGRWGRRDERSPAGRWRLARAAGARPRGKRRAGPTIKAQGKAPMRQMPRFLATGASGSEELTKRLSCPRRYRHWTRPPTCRRRISRADPRDNSCPAAF